MSLIKEELYLYKNKFQESNKEEFVAKFLLAEILNISTSDLMFKLDEELDKKCTEKFHTFCNKYLNGTPAEYIVKKCYFYGLDFYVDNRVLIPRNETEELVELLLKNNDSNTNLKVLDLCTGSGCIGISIKANRPNYRVYLSDIDRKCINVCKINKERRNVDVKLLVGDLFEPLEKENLSFDILICNPPYIAKDDPNVNQMTSKEPSKALYTQDDKGLEFYKRIFDYLKNYPFKKAYFEFGFNQKNDLEKLLKDYQFKYNFYKDISHNDRMLEIIR